MPETALATLAWALTEGPDAAFATADAAAERLAQRRYATILRLEDGTISRRLFSSVPDAYPVGETKTLPPSPWRSHVVDRAEIFMASGPAEIAAHFPDFALVARLGGQCLVNLPVRGRDGGVIGLFNVASARTFSPAELGHLRLLAAILGPAVAGAPVRSAP